MLPINFLKQLIGLYGNSMQNFVPQYLEAAMDAFQRNQSAARMFGSNMFADLAKRNMAMFEDASGRSGVNQRQTQSRPPTVTWNSSRPSSQRSRPKSIAWLKVMVADCCSACADRRIVARCADRAGDCRPQHRDSLAGNWRYAATTDGDATFSNVSGNPQVWMHCTRDSPSNHRQTRGRCAPFINVGRAR
jgi:hypothetical protein